MKDLIIIIKVIVISQGVLILGVIALLYLTKLTQSINKKRRIKLTNNATLELSQWAVAFDPQQIAALKKYKNQCELLLPVIKQLDSEVHSESWIKTRNHLLSHYFIPQARRMVISSNWYKRLLACTVFQLSYEQRDEHYLLTLIRDKTPLVAINATQLALLYPSQTLINEIIRCFTNNRRLQNSLLLQTITIEQTALPFIANCLNQERAPYTRILCYRMLNEFNNEPQIIDDLEANTNDSNLDLQIAATNYFCNIHPTKAVPLLLKKLTSTQWEIRANATRLAGLFPDNKLIQPLLQALADPTWWVRVNAAESLTKIGPDGIEALKTLAPEYDAFAYDTAKRVLANFNYLEEL